jgi:hypothetical protein
MRLSTRVAKVERALAERLATLGRPDQFDIVEVVPVGGERAEGRAPGLYRDGPEGSTAGVLVFDPAEHEPAVSSDRLTPWGLVISCHLPHEEHLWSIPAQADAGETSQLSPAGRGE